MEHKTKSAASEGDAERAKTLKFLSGCTLGLAFLSQLILDVLRCEWNLIQHNTHKYISAKWWADC
jgi:hypothetical protein